MEGKVYRCVGTALWAMPVPHGGQSMTIAPVGWDGNWKGPFPKGQPARKGQSWMCGSRAY